MGNLLSSSIGRKFLMALSAFFLITFLLTHIFINMLSLISEEVFNDASYFMGTNPLVQFIFQPILFAGIFFHFILGFYLELQNYRARGQLRYLKNKASKNASWVSRNMVYTGGAILLFLGLHLYDFWIPTLNAHYVTHQDLNYYQELIDNFESPVRVVIYVVAFFFLAMHLWHGFQSAFQSVGFRKMKYLSLIQNAGKIFSIVIPSGFIIIAIVHHFNQ